VRELKDGQIGRLLKKWTCVSDGVTVFLHRVSKNVPPSTCYNVDIHDLITILFGRNVTGTEKVRNYMMLCFVFPLHLSSASGLPCEIANPEDSPHWCIVHATQSNCCSAIDFLSS